MANLPTRNNNPGDLKDPSTGMFQKYDNPEAGFTALKNDLQGKISGNTKTGLNGDSTLQDFASTWAPDSDNNNSKQYAANLAKKLGVTTDTPISKLSGRLDDFASAIADNEGYQGNRVLGSETASTKLSPVDFAAKIKAKYPQYANVDDNTLTQKILAKYPQYSDLVGGGQTNAQTNNEQPNSGGFITSAKIPPPAPSASAPTDNTDKGFVGNLLSGNIGGAASDAVQGVGNALTFGGAKQLGDYFGTNIAQMTAGDNAKYVDPNGGDLGSGLAGAVKTGLGIAGVEGGIYLWYIAKVVYTV